jgi:hypothetical protein
MRKAEVLISAKREVMNAPHVDKQTIAVERQPRNVEVPTTTKNIGVAVAATLGLISLAGLAMTLMGFGVAIAAGASFGVSFLRVAESPFQCLKLSSVVFIQLFNTVDAIDSNLGDTLVFCLSAMVCLLIYLLIQGLMQIRKKNNTIVRATLSPRDFLKRVPPLGALLFGLGFGAVGVFISHVFKVILLSIPVLIVMFPVIGYNLGNRFFYEATIEPKKCFSLVNAATTRVSYAQSLVEEAAKPKSGRQEYRATCLALTKLDGQEVMRGRLALELSDAVILYFPDTGASEIVPNKDVRTVKVSSLNLAAAPKQP